MNCTTKNDDGYPEYIRDVQGNHRDLPDDLRHEFDSLWLDARLSPRDRLILIARLARYDDRIAGIVVDQKVIGELHTEFRSDNRGRGLFVPVALDPVVVGYLVVRIRPRPDERNAVV